MKRVLVVARLRIQIIGLWLQCRELSMRALAGETLAETAEAVGLDAAQRLPSYSYQNYWNKALRNKERALSHARRRLYNIGRNT